MYHVIRMEKGFEKSYPLLNFVSTFMLSSDISSEHKRAFETRVATYSSSLKRHQIGREAKIHDERQTLISWLRSEARTSRPIW